MTRREWVGAWAVIAAAVLVAYSPVAIGAESFYHHDRYFLHVPFWHAAWAAIGNGHFPFWIPGIRAGYPLLANGEASLLYPFTYLFEPFFSAHRALDLFTIFHLALGGGFCWLYLRRLTHQNVLALTGAIAFALSGRMSGMTIWGHAVAAAAYLPLLLWAIDRRHIVWMAVAIGFGALTGRPQVHVLTMLIGASYAALRIGQAWRQSGRLPASHAVAVGVAFFLGFCLGAAQLLPTLAFVGESSRSGGTTLQEWSSFALGTSHLLEMFVPGAYPNGWPEASWYPTLFVYVGVGIAVYRLFTSRGEADRIEFVFWLVLAGVSMYVAFGAPGAYVVSQELPLIRSFRVPARFAQVAAFALLVVATLAWRRPLARAGRWTWLVLAVVLLDGAMSSFVGRHTVVASAYEQTQRYVPELREAGLDKTGSMRRYYADSAWVEPREIANQTRETVDRLFANVPPTRNLALRYGLRSVQGFGEPNFYWFPPKRELITPTMFRQFGTEFLIFRQAVRHPDLMPLRTHGPRSRAYRLRSPLPRASVVYELMRSRDWEEAFAVASSANFDATMAAVVETDVEFVPSARAASGSVRLQSEAPNRITFRVQSTRKGFLVLFDTWGPGWTATVDGVAQRVFRANGVFRLVTIPEGESVVVFRYVPPGFLVGIFLGVSSVLVLACITFVRVRRNRVVVTGSDAAPESSTET